MLINKLFFLFYVLIVYTTIDLDCRGEGDQKY